MSIYNKDFYPTPELVGNQMCIETSIYDKVVFEPNIGKGDLVEVIRGFSPKEILGCEKSNDLAAIGIKKVDRFLGSDVFDITKEDISHVNVIIANPPFRNADKHILHLWEIAPEGCEIVSLCNWETITNKYSRTRSRLSEIIDNNGSKKELGDCFSDAERSTDVNVGLIHIFKPKTGENEFEGYFDLDENIVTNQIEGVLRYSYIDEVINRYIGAVKYYDEVIEAQDRINSLISPISHKEHSISFKVGFDNKNDNFTSITRDVFKKELQKGAWKTIFSKFDLDRYVTSNVMADINKFVEEQSKIPFTKNNIFKMVDMIFGTRDNTMNKVIIEVFDWLTDHYYDNRLSLEGWKTNSEYIVNKKFIAPYCGVKMGFSGQPSIEYSSGGNRLDDLVKALCYITGTAYDKSNSIEQFYGYYGENVEYEKVDVDCIRDEEFDYLEEKKVYTNNNYEKVEIHNLFKFKKEKDYVYVLSNGYDNRVKRYKLFGKWYNWTFFKIKVFKKGTMHVVFKDDNVWEQFNRTAAKAKGFQLASNFRSDLVKNKNGVIKL